jgi:glycosyltransferase involved in cell wall biosynthesis
VSPDRLLAEIDVLVVPSIWHEPLGRVVLEAYAFGVPVIATCLGGTPEIVDDGETGLLFDPRVPGELAHTIGMLAADPSRTTAMGEKALGRSADFTPQRILAEHREVYAPHHGKGSLQT